MKPKLPSQPMSANKSGLGISIGIGIGATFKNIVLGVG